MGLSFEITYISICVAHLSVFQCCICRSVRVFFISVVTRIVDNVFHAQFTAFETFVTLVDACRSIRHIFFCPFRGTFCFVGSIASDEWFPETGVVDTVEHLHGIFCCTDVREFTSAGNVTFTTTYVIALIYRRIIKMHLVSITSPCWFIIGELGSQNYFADFFVCTVWLLVIP